MDAAAVERVLFAMVANRLTHQPLSKLAGCKWVAERVFIDGLDAVSDDAYYRAMDFFMAALPQLQEQIFFSVANLLNLEVDCSFAIRRPRSGRPKPPTTRRWPTTPTPAVMVCDQLPLYHEDHACKTPTAARVLEILQPLARTHITHDGDTLAVIPPDLTPLQRQLLDLLDVPLDVYQTQRATPQQILLEASPDLRNVG